MKKIIILFVLFSFQLSYAQKKGEDYSKLPTLDFVKLTMRGLGIEKKMWQDSIVKIDQLKLTGTDSQNFTIVYYRFKTNYKKSLTVDEFYDGNIPVPMNTFFKDLESNCKISFEDVVVKHKENGKLFKIMPLSILVKI